MHIDIFTKDNIPVIEIRFVISTVQERVFVFKTLFNEVFNHRRFLIWIRFVFCGIEVMINLLIIEGDFHSEPDAASLDKDCNVLYIIPSSHKVGTKFTF